MARTRSDKISRLRAAIGAAAMLVAVGVPAAHAASETGGSAPGAAQAPAPSPPAGKTGGTLLSGKSSSLHVTSIRITSAQCVPATRCSGNPRQVSIHGTLLVAGKGLRSQMLIAFPHAPGARISSSSPEARLRQSSEGLIVTVPRDAHSGHIQVLLGGGRYTSSYGPIYVFAHALHPPTPIPQLDQVGAAPGETAFNGQGMWIWYVSQSDGGSIAAIAAEAHAAGVGTLYVKSSDGASNYWSQFSPALVAELHANGLRVCAWQYVYGSDPAGEAKLGAEAVANGAECLVIDAEAEYEGRYAAAQTYLADLRAEIGPGFPLGLTSFPYVYYHTAEPYSVFLGPGGAQFDLPQMYWKAIGNSVDTVYANTYISNRVYGRPIDPLGQSYEGPSGADVLRFREEAVDYGASGISWWDWQETAASGWAALADPLAPLSSVTPNPGYSELAQGSKGDPVLWMQEHLASAIPSQETTGIFSAATAADLEQFQALHGITPSGHTEAATWAALLALPPVAVNWTGGGPKG